MRYILLVILVLISFGTSAQAPPMNIGGPQGINVKRILAQDWMSVPIMADTPVAPLTGSGWPGKGYLVFVAQNPDSICFGCPPADTSLWEYTGQRWKRVGMDYLTKLVFGGDVTQSNTFSRRFFVGSYGAFINGSYYTKLPITILTTSPKVADSTSRIDAIVLTPLGPTIKVGNPKQVPLKPSIASDEIELSTIYFPPFDTVARFIPVATGVTSIFRVPGKDSIFYSIDTTTFAIKDSIGIAVATNGLTANDKTIKLGGSLTENTNINLSGNRLNVFTGSDTARFINSGGLNFILKGAGNNQVSITKDYILSGNTSNTRSAFLDFSGSLGLNNGTSESYIDNVGVTNPLVTLSIPNKTSGSYTIAVTSDTVNLSNRINLKVNISDTAAMLNPYKFTAANGLTKDSTVFRLGGSLNQNTNINLSTRRFDIIGGTDTTRFFSNARVSIGGTPDSTNTLNVNGSARINGILRLAPSSPSNAAVIVNQNSNDGSLAWVSNVASLPSNFGARNIIISPSGAYSNLTGGQNVLIGRGAGWIMTTGAGNTFLGNNSGSSIITGLNNTFIGASDGWTTLPSTTSNTIQIISNGHENNMADTVLLGLTSNYAFIGGGNSSGYVRDYYFGGGNRIRRPDLSDVNFYAPSGYPTAIDTIGSNFTINAGRGTGTGIGGSIIFRTSFTTTPGATLQTLQERVRISHRGNLLVGTATDDTSSLVNIVSTTKGFLQPRMTNTQRDAITTPATGLELFSTTDSANYVYRGTGGGWQKIANEISGSATLDFPSTNNGNESDLTITVTGASEGDVVSLGIPNSVNLNHSCFTAWVSAANTVTVRFNNYGTGALDPASATFKVKVFK